MRILFVGLLLLLPVLAWGAEKKAAKEKAPTAFKEDFRKDLEEDICYVFSEYYEARQLTSSSYRPNSPEGRLARAADLKRSRLLTLQKRYVKRYGSEFNAFSNPSLCPDFR